jgi:hypothetical protein
VPAPHQENGYRAPPSREGCAIHLAYGGLAAQVAALIAAAAEGSGAQLPAVDALIDALDVLLKQEELLVTRPHRARRA